MAPTPTGRWYKVEFYGYLPEHIPPAKIADAYVLDKELNRLGLAMGFTYVACPSAVEAPSYRQEPPEIKSAPLMDTDFYACAECGVVVPIAVTDDSVHARWHARLNKR